MASTVRFQVFLFGALLLVTSAFAQSSNTGFIASYWGQGLDIQVEGTLAAACTSGHYKVIMIAFIANFGNFQTPQLSIGQCDASSGGCTGLSADIDTCHQSGVKVLVSLGGAAGSYGLVSTADAQDLAMKLWNNFLGGQSDSRPLGPSSLDGVDFDIEQGSSSFYGDLATALRSQASGWSNQLYLSAAPQCPFPDAHLGPAGSGTALDTERFDYVWVQFYNNYCQFTGDANAVVSVFNQWSSALPNSLIFLGLPAAPMAAGSGYVTPDDVVSTLLPAIKANGGPNYGGVMLFSVYWDNTQSPTFSQAISSAL